jgi:hypothetical protein
MRWKLLFCIAPTRRQAEDIVHRLESEHFSDDQISVIFPDRGALPLPGIGPFIAAGPLIAALSEAPDTGGRGIAGGLMGLGVPEAKAEDCQNKIESGNFLISVHATTTEEVGRAMRIVSGMGVQDIYNPCQDCTAPSVAEPMGAAAPGPG